MELLGARVATRFTNLAADHRTGVARHGGPCIAIFHDCMQSDSASSPSFVRVPWGSNAPTLDGRIDFGGGS